MSCRGMGFPAHAPRPRPTCSPNHRHRPPATPPRRTSGRVLHKLTHDQHDDHQHGDSQQQSFNSVHDRFLSREKIIAFDSNHAASDELSHSFEMNIRKPRCVRSVTIRTRSSVRARTGETSPWHAQHSRSRENTSSISLRIHRNVHPLFILQRNIFAVAAMICGPTLFKGNRHVGRYVQQRATGRFFHNHSHARRQRTERSGL